MFVSDCTRYCLAPLACAGADVLGALVSNRVMIDCPNGRQLATAIEYQDRRVGWKVQLQVRHHPYVLFCADTLWHHNDQSIAWADIQFGNCGMLTR